MIEYIHTHQSGFWIAAGFIMLAAEVLVFGFTTIVLLFAADRFSALKLTFTEIAGRVSARLIDHVGQRVCTVLGQRLTGQRMAHQCAVEFLHGSFEAFRINGFWTFSAGRINHDDFHSLRAHDGTQTASTAMPSLCISKHISVRKS